MTAVSLDSVFNWSSTNLPDFPLTVITDSLNCDGGFLLHHWLSLYTKGLHPIVLVGIENGFTHYFNIGKKLGINLAEAHAKGLFSFINLLSNPYSWTDEVTVEGNPSITTISTQHSFTLEGGTPFYDLYNHICQVANKHNGKICLIFDNINYLLHYAHSPLMVLEFIQYCSAYVQENKGSLVAFVHSDTDDTIFLNTLKHRASLCIDVCALSTGYSTEVDGELKFSIHPINHLLQNSTQKTLTSPPTLQYKLLETSIKYFPVSKAKV